MLIVNIKGGLGNQLFQYAFGKYLALKNQDNLYLDLSFYDDLDQHRSFNLDKFNLDYKRISDRDVARYRKSKNPLINKIINSIIGNFSVYIERKVGNFDNSFLNRSQGYFEGYWQSEKYFISIRQILLQEITLKEIDNRISSLGSQIESRNSVSIHIRKTDYLIAENKKIYADCGKSYYNNAISKILENCENPHFYIFADDFKWVEENLDIPYPHEFVVNNSAEEDLYLMSLCKHNIIANSTFSWWGAWLNKNYHKVVIAPKYWFNNNSLTNEDIIPDSWIKISN